MFMSRLLWLLASSISLGLFVAVDGLTPLSSPQSSSSSLAPPLSSFALRSAAMAGIDIRETKCMGLGAFASSVIPAGTMLGEYTGELITEYEVQTRYRGQNEESESDKQWAASRDARSQTRTGSYLFDMGSGILIDAEDTDTSGWCRYMNHAKEGTNDCNVRPFHRETIGGGFHKPRFFATREIQTGEEIKYDYGGVFWESS